MDEASTLQESEGYIVEKRRKKFTQDCYKFDLETVSCMTQEIESLDVMSVEVDEELVLYNMK